MLRHLGHSHGNAHQRGDDDTEKQRALDIARHEHTAHQNGNDAQDSRRRESTQRHKSVGIADDDARVFQSDECDEHADAHRDGIAQIGGNGVENIFAHMDERDQQEDHALDKRDGQCLLPRIAKRLAQCEGEESVQSHARSLRKRQFGEEGQQHRGYRRGQRRAGEQCRAVHAGIAQHSTGDELSAHTHGFGVKT